MTRTRVTTTLLALAATLVLAAPATAVTGGTPASRDYPHMAALFDDGTFICGASLIDPEWILTAAHCVEGAESRERDLSFAIGGDNLNSSGGERRGAIDVRVHESWDPDTLRYDVALVRLDATSSKTPVRLADPETERSLWAAGETARVIGYGLPSLDLVGALLETNVPMVSDQDCTDSYDLTDDLTGGGFDPATMVCAGELYGVKDACFGDSGGPLMVPVAGGTLDGGTLIQVGVVSWGFLCGVPTQYGVYSRVADTALHDWIEARGGAPSSPGAIAGKVTDAKTKTGLASATVSCGDAGSATTAADGHYDIGGVPIGSYSCTASKTGYRAKTQTAAVSSGSTTTANFALQSSLPGKPKRK